MPEGNYLHGVETLRIKQGKRQIRTVKSAVIGLLMSAPCGPVNTPTLLLSENDGAQFGPAIPGFTGPQALEDIFGFRAATIIAINVCDPAVHKAAVTDEVVVLNPVTGRARLAHGAVSGVAVKAGAVACALTTDYTLNALTGELQRVASGKIPASTTSLTVSYSHVDPTKVLAADIIGTINVAGMRSGMKALLDCRTLYGFDARILIAPGFSSLNSVAAEMHALADRLGAVDYVDAPIGTTFAQAIAGRGPAGSINFNTSSNRARLCYPHVKVPDSWTSGQRLAPLSSLAAGLRAKTDLDDGFWFSSSNRELARVIGLERPLTARIDDAQSEVNLLNEQGITTVFNDYGTGFRLWGNTTANFPAESGLVTFECVGRTADMIDESIRMASLPFIDLPIDEALIDTILASVDEYGLKLIGCGALLGFKCWFNPQRNPTTELAAGHLVVSYRYTPKPPGERITYESEITDEFLVTLKSGGK